MSGDFARMAFPNGSATYRAARHFWGSEMVFASDDPGQNHRGLDTAPEGRGQWFHKVNY